jgi:hypothetical protein
MKKTAYFLLPVMITLFSSLQCEKEPQIPVYAGKVVRIGSCDKFVVELTSPLTDTAKFNKQWTDPSSGITYQHVFNVTNSCDFLGTWHENDVIRFLITGGGPGNCISCLAIEAKPSKQFIIVKY